LFETCLPSPKPTNSQPEISTENAEPDNLEDPPAFSYAMIGGGIGGVVVIVCLVVVIVVLVKKWEDRRAGGQMVQV
jgi:hypothetical protein